MRVKKFLYSLLLVLFASIFVVQPALAITQQQLEDFANNNIMFYDPGDQDISSCYSTSANLVEETDRESIIWNWFVQANIPGISNSAEVIAGILGNFKAEGGNLDPFAWEGKGHGYGLYRATGNEYFVSEMEKEFGSNIWNTTSQLSAETVKRGIEKELEIIVSSTYNWNHSGFPDALDVPANKAGEDGAAAYAELFVLTFERPSQFATIEEFPENVRLSAFKIQDPGVASYEFIKYPDRTTNFYYLFGNKDGQPRRTYYAREYYRRFSDNQIFATSQATVSGSDITVIGDESISDARASIEQTIGNVEIKTVNNLTEVASAIADTTRENIIIAIDLSKEMLGEENLSNALADTDSKKIYFIADQSLNTNSDSFEPNRALIASNGIQVLNVSGPNEIATKISSLFEQPVTTMCSSSSSSGSIPELYGRDIETYAAYAQILGKINANSDHISCPAGTVPVLNYAGTSDVITVYISGSKREAHLCAVPSINGTVGIASLYKGKTFSKCSNNTDSKSITVPQQNDPNGFDFKFETDIQKPATGAVFNATVAQVYYVFGEYMKTILNLGKNEGLKALSSYRSQAFQTIIHAVNPYNTSQGSCTIGDTGTWGGAGGPTRSNHASGIALDLDTKELANKYSSNANGFKEFVDSLPSNHKCFYNSDSNKAVDIPSSWWSANSSKGTLYDKFFCNVLPKFHLYFTVDNEDWHIEAKEI